MAKNEKTEKKSLKNTSDGKKITAKAKKVEKISADSPSKDTLGTINVPQISNDNILDRENFGAFEVIKTDRGIMFKTYTGYHIYTTPYAVGLDGVAHTNSLYAWLDNLLETKKSFEGHMDEQFEDYTHDDGTPLLCKELFDMDVIVTASTLLSPLTAFVDLDKAIEKANEHIKWLNEKQKELQEAMESETSGEEEDAVVDAEERAKVEHQDVFEEMANENINS